ncbi:MAG: hypothetical protein LBD68_11400 [Zoogloeaceae bacterium]|jgi:hypothetical protein|nr:hypothetical protein [Zoogloeaceae bacterium]
MANFRDVLARRMDDIVFSTLHDEVTLNGKPTRGMFSAPWLSPELGRLKTGLVEPMLALRDKDAVAALRGDVVVFEGKSYAVVSVEPDGTGITTLVLRPE